MIVEAIKHFVQFTPIRFIRRTTQRNYVEFINGGQSMCSHLGMLGIGKQKTKIAEWATLGNVIHELGHVVGLIHEHSRSDRDDYISIHFENIKESKIFCFEKLNYSLNSTAFDFGSIMMYSSFAKTKNGMPTITRPDGNLNLEHQREKLSDGDIAAILELYKDEIYNTCWPSEKLHAVILDQAFLQALVRNGLCYFTHHNLNYISRIEAEKITTLDISFPDDADSENLNDSSYPASPVREQIESLIGIEAFTNLEELNCKGNMIHRLNLLSNQKLKFLDCDHNKLKSIDLSGCVDLMSLSCSNNLLKNLDISTNYKLDCLIIKNMPCLEQVMIWTYPVPAGDTESTFQVYSEGSPNFVFVVNTQK